MLSCYFLLFLIPHLCFFTIFLLFETTFSYVDPKFQACEPKTCGNGQNISYPFYIQGKQEPFCGYPGLELTCGNNGFPILNLTNTQYTVLEISYSNHSLRVSNPAFSESNASACFAPTQNITFGKYMLEIAPNQRDLFLFYGCDSTSLPDWMKEQEIGCSAENRTSSVVGLYNAEGQNLRLMREKCKGRVVNAKVGDDEKGGVQEALRKGFVLNWIASGCGLRSPANTSNFRQSTSGIFIGAICLVDLAFSSGFSSEGVSVHAGSIFSANAKPWQGPFLCADCHNRKDAMEEKRTSGVKVSLMILNWFSLILYVLILSLS